ncbi:MAG: CvpA family protein [Chloroflexi bacterium]|nr:CvpA family protein [Chloroflexota bacterium]
MLPIANVNWIDFSVAFLVLSGGTAGLFQGLLRQALFIGGVYISTVLAAQYYGIVGDQIGLFIPQSDHSVRNALALILIFLVVVVITHWLTYGVYTDTRLPFLSAVDHLGGAILGLVGAWTLAGVTITMLIFALGLSWHSWEPLQNTVRSELSQSVLLPALRNYLPLVYETIRPWLPSGLPAPFVM